MAQRAVTGRKVRRRVRGRSRRTHGGRDRALRERQGLDVSSKWRTNTSQQRAHHRQEHGDSTARWVVECWLIRQGERLLVRATIELLGSQRPLKTEGIQLGEPPLLSQIPSELLVLGNGLQESEQRVSGKRSKRQQSREARNVDGGVRGGMVDGGEFTRNVESGAFAPPKRRQSWASTSQASGVASSRDSAQVDVVLAQETSGAVVEPGLYITRRMEGTEDVRCGERDHAKRIGCGVAKRLYLVNNFETAVAPRKRKSSCIQRSHVPSPTQSETPWVDQRTSRVKSRRVPGLVDRGGKTSRATQKGKAAETLASTSNSDGGEAVAIMSTTGWIRREWRRRSGTAMPTRQLGAWATRYSIETGDGVEDEARHQRLFKTEDLRFEKGIASTARA
ncbi:hypothetical protein R3P38DRAFT_2797880 [Favolaschia claudopus]|uniref:Uncharacterized protein n=1 Tax=Favolaschia claudopus TaxID=2862362 RepID=A0AAW0A235_9AGAR